MVTRIVRVQSDCKLEMFHWNEKKARCDVRYSHLQFYKQSVQSQCRVKQSVDLKRLCPVRYRIQAGRPSSVKMHYETSTGRPSSITEPKIALFFFHPVLSLPGQCPDSFCPLFTIALQFPQLCLVQYQLGCAGSSTYCIIWPPKNPARGASSDLLRTMFG